MSENFAKLEQWNPLLASEIRKLPEFQDGITIQEKKALDDLVELYADNPKVFSNAFKQMYQVGIPEVRKYCSPLQAMYWLLLDNKLNIFNQIARKYDLKLLLDKSWGQGIKGHYLGLSLEKVHEIAKSINGKEGAYIPDNVSTDVLKKIIIYNYFENPTVFHKKHKAYMANALNNEFNNRWKNFDTVADRLNSPELVDYWVNQVFTYGPPIIGYTKTATKTFKDRGGDCSDICQLGKIILDRSGVKITKICTQGHVMGYTKKDKMYWIVLDYSSKGNTIHQPLDHLPNDLIPCGSGVNP